MPPLRAVFTSTCTHGTASCPWVAGDVTTYSKEDWDQDPPIGGILAGNFATVYPALEVVVGIDGTPGVYSMVFRTVAAILTYLPTTQPPPSGSPLNQNWVDPADSSPVGVGPFGGEALALRLNIDFSAAGALPRVYSLGDLRICGLDPGLSSINGLTINDFMTVANSALAGGVALYPLDFLDNVANLVNTAFMGGVASTFANDHLVAGSCP